MKGRKGKPEGKRNFSAMFSDKPAEKEDMPPVMGGKARLRLDRPGRRLGGRVGADRSPLATAARNCD